MVIGIDASRAFVGDRTGTENYSYELITRMIRLPAAKKHSFVLFTRPNAIIPKEVTQVANLVIKKINFPILWTQVGLAAYTWLKYVNLYSRKSVNPDQKHKIKRKNGFTDSRYIDVLWIPAHTLPVLRNPRVKTVVTIHGLEYRWLPEYHNLLQRWYLPLSTFYAAKAADKLICVSKSTKRDLIEEVKFDIEKASVIYEGTTYSRVPVIPYSRRILGKYGIEHKKYVLFVGTVQPRKNLSALIAAFAKFSSSNPEFKLVIAGSVGWKAARDLSMPEKLGIPDKVVFVGRVTQAVLSALYQGAALYVQPSWTEGFGLPVLEAMASSVPTIVSDGGALPEVVGQAALVVQLGNDQSSITNNQTIGFEERLAESIAKVLGDQKLQKRLIVAGRQRVMQLSWERAANETLDFITRG